jgi:hypothetical protein
MFLGRIALRTAAMAMKTLSRFGIDRIAINSSLKAGNLVDKFVEQCVNCVAATKKPTRIQKVLEKLLNRELDELDIPLALRPKLKLINTKRIPRLKNLAGGYDPRNNEILINIANTKLNERLNYFMLRILFRHEAKHAQQYIEIARAGLGSKLNVKCFKLLEKAKAYPIELSEDRVTLANNYLNPFEALRRTQPIALLFASNLRKLKYRSFFEFLDKSSKRERIDFWGNIAQDLKSRGRFLRCIPQFKRINSQNLQVAVNRYLSHSFEEEARKHQHIFSPNINALEKLPILIKFQR